MCSCRSVLLDERTLDKQGQTERSRRVDPSRSGHNSPTYDHDDHDDEDTGNNDDNDDEAAVEAAVAAFKAQQLAKLAKVRPQPRSLIILCTLTLSQVRKGKASQSGNKKTRQVPAAVPASQTDNLAVKRKRECAPG